MSDQIVTPQHVSAATTYINRCGDRWYLLEALCNAERRASCCPSPRGWAGSSFNTRHFRTKKHIANTHGITVQELNHAIKVLKVLQALES